MEEISTFDTDKIHVHTNPHVTRLEILRPM